MSSQCKKRLVFCFDGSWGGLDAPHPTNVLLTAESVLPFARQDVAQVVFYQQGVGTAKGERLAGGLFGAGLLENLEDGYRHLIFNYAPGDEIFVFGFSRGAFTARSLVGLISNSGILRRRNAGRVGEAIALYRKRTDTPEHHRAMYAFRHHWCADVVISDEEDTWRTRNVPDYAGGDMPRLKVRYLGVWETVGALGIPAYVWKAESFNREFQFHDTKLSAVVEFARHAVSIDERMKDFSPTLWTNLAELNADRAARIDAVDAPYQQRWFPGMHGSVGGGGARRGLSDQALDWMWDGARQAGLALDASPTSRLDELTPSVREHLRNTPDRPGLVRFVLGHIPEADRVPGPLALHEVSVGARRRWQEKPEHLPEQTTYRPRTLERVAPDLDAPDPVRMETGDGELGSTDFVAYEVVPGDTLRLIARAFYGDPEQWPRIFFANRHKLWNPGDIHLGQFLRVPR